jgi:uncharacterized RDD family membrane protein YckC
VSYPYQATPDPTAVVGRRVVATLVDGLVIAGPATAIAVAELDLQYLEEADLQVPAGDFCDLLREESTTSLCFTADDRVYFSDNTPVAGWLTGLVLSLALLVLLQGIKGTTPGKALMGIRTVGADGRAPGIGKALVRWLLLAVDLFPWCIPGLLGLIVAGTTKGHQRVGDKAASTFVVSKGAFGQPLQVPGVTTGAPAYAGGGYGAPGQPGPGTGPGWGPPPGAAPGPGSGDAWGPAAQQQPAAGGWGRDPASSDSWAPAQPYGTPAPAPAPPAGASATTPSGERPAAPSGPPSGPPTSERPAPPGWAAPGEPQGAPPASAPAPSPAGPPSADEGEHAVPFSPEPSRVAGATATSSDPADGADRPGSPPTDATEVVGASAAPDGPADTPAGSATGNGEPGGEPDHPLDVSPPPGSPSAADATVVAGPSAAPAPSEPDPDATVVSGAGLAPAGDPDATIVGQTPEADRTMIAPSPAAAEPAGGAAAQPQAQYNPQWDAARGTYIVWEPGRAQWLGWDDNAKEWRPL